MNGEAVFHPLDFDLLEKGQIISKEQLVEITGYDPDKSIESYKKFQFGRLAVISQIRQQRPELVARANGDTIEILVDEVATDHCQRQFLNRFSAALRENASLAGVEVSNLSEKARIRHDRALVIQGSMLQAAQRAEKKALNRLAKKQIGTGSGSKRVDQADPKA